MLDRFFVRDTFVHYYCLLYNNNSCRHIGTRRSTNNTYSTELQVVPILRYKYSCQTSNKTHGDTNKTTVVLCVQLDSMQYWSTQALGATREIGVPIKMYVVTMPTIRRCYHSSSSHRCFSVCGRRSCDQSKEYQFKPTNITNQTTTSPVPEYERSLRTMLWVVGLAWCGHQLCERAPPPRTPA